MREPDCCSEVRLRLTGHGLPSARINRIACELAEHWEDLRQEARAKGLSEEDSSARADARLGDPRQLAETVIAGLGRSSWLGRHPVITVGLLPLLLVPLLMSAVFFPLWGVDQLLHFLARDNFASHRNAQLIVSGFWIVHGVALVAAPVWLCHRIWRAGLGLRWIMAACSWCALFALMRSFHADAVKRFIAVSVRFPWRLDLTTALILLLHLIVAAAFIHSVRKAMSQNRQPVESKTSSII
jgi:hypothetical protein